MSRRRLHTEIVIDASPAEVWSVLTDWLAYPEWNPFVTSIRGEFREGAKLAVKLKMGPRPLTIRPKLVRVDEGHEFRWLGHAGLPGVFSGEHGFSVEPFDGQRTCFIHAESFCGILVRPVFQLLGGPTRKGFEAMNRALKERCESSRASVPSSA